METAVLVVSGVDAKDLRENLILAAKDIYKQKGKYVDRGFYTYTAINEAKEKDLDDWKDSKTGKDK